MKKYTMEITINKVPTKLTFDTEKAASAYVRTKIITDSHKEILLNIYKESTKEYLTSFKWSRLANGFITGPDSIYSLSEFDSNNDNDNNLENSMAQKGMTNFYESKKDIKGAKAEVMQIMFEALKERGYEVFGSNETNQPNWTMVIKHHLTDLKFTMTSPQFNRTYYEVKKSKKNK